jgi:small-conductance mechanosensitive channel
MSEKPLSDKAPPGKNSPKQTAKDAAAKLVKANLAKIDQLKAESIEITDQSIETRDATKLNVKDQIDSMKAQHRAELNGLPRGSKSAVRARQQADLKAFRDKAKSDLANLKTTTRQKIDGIKAKIQKLRKENGSALSGGTTTGFYTDKDGKRRPLTAPKGR